MRGPGCLWRHGCSGRRRARPPARLGGLTAFGAAPRSPPVPSGPSGALRTSGAGSLLSGSARRLEARPGPATAHGHRSPRAPDLRRPPHQWGLRCCCLVRCVVSKPGQALPPPTGTAARALRTLRRPPRQWGLARCDFWPIFCVLLQTSSIQGVFRVVF